MTENVYIDRKHFLKTLKYFLVVTGNILRYLFDALDEPLDGNVAVRGLGGGVLEVLPEVARRHDLGVRVLGRGPAHLLLVLVLAVPLVILRGTLVHTSVQTLRGQLS